MTSETDWSHDYCLYCDKQTMGGLYCSQACRLADVEDSESLPSTPSLTSAHSEAAWDYTFSWSPESQSYSLSKDQTTNFKLPPRFDFDKYREATPKATMDSPPQSPRNATSTSSHNRLTEKKSRPAYSHRATTSSYEARNRSLNTSSSRSSLSSVVSTASAHQGLSEQAISQLQNYSNSFDHTRDWKRRVTLG